MRKSFKEWFMKIFGGSKKDLEVPAEEERVTPVTPHDYGLSLAPLVLQSDDYGWTIRSFKKVILTNPQDCKDKITFMGMVAAWKGTGHSEWEFLMSAWFVDSVVGAIHSGAEEADISMLFDRDLLASSDRVFTQEQVYEHLMPWFEKVEENDDVLKLKLKIQ